MLFHRGSVEIMLDGGHTRVTEGRQTKVKVVGALVADWSIDKNVWLVSYVWILSIVPVRMLYVSASSPCLVSVYGTVTSQVLARSC